MALKDYFQLMRPVNCLMAAVAVLVGFIVSSDTLLPSNSLFLAMLAAFLVCGGGQAVNDFFDYKIDAKKNQKTKKPIVEGKIKPVHALVFSLALFGAGIICSFFVNLHAFAIATGFTILLFVYSWQLGKIKPIGNIVVSLGTAAPIVFGATISQNYFLPIVFAATAFFANLGREITKDIEDAKADAGEKKTIAHFLPKKTAEYIVLACYLLAGTIAVSVWVLGKSSGVVYIGLVLFSTALFFYAWIVLSQNDAAKSQKISKRAMLVALCAFVSWVVF